MKLAKQIFDIGYFFRALQVQMRFGDLSRAPLQLLRLELKGKCAECEWIARGADDWDEVIPVHVSESHISTQALKDAIDVREMLFGSLPGVDTALLRVFRQSAAGSRELIITGTVARDQPPAGHVTSLAMRAKLLGLQFTLADGFLESVQSEEYAMTF